MFKFIKRIMGLSGEYRKKLDRAYVLSFFESLASNVPICMLLYVLMTINERQLRQEYYHHRFCRHFCRCYPQNDIPLSDGREPVGRGI